MKKMKENPKGMDRKFKILVRNIYIYIYDPFFRAHMFTFSHCLPQIKRVMIQGVTKNI